MNIITNMSVKLDKEQITHIITKAIELETHHRVNAIKFNVSAGWRGDMSDPGSPAALESIDIQLGELIVNKYAGQGH